MHSPTLSPAGFNGAVSPELGLTHAFTLGDVPVAGLVMARVAAGDDGGAAPVAVRRVVVSERVTRAGSACLVPVCTGDGSAPIAVAPGQVLRIELRVSDLAPGVTRASATLLVSGEGWGTLAAPLHYVPETDVLTVYGALTLDAPQGGQGSVGIVARVVAGPAVEVRYELIDDAQADRIALDAPALRVAPGMPQRATLRFRVGADCPPGVRALRVLRRGGSRLDDECLLRLEVMAIPTQAPGT